MVRASVLNGLSVRNSTGVVQGHLADRAGSSGETACSRDGHVRSLAQLTLGVQFRLPRSRSGGEGHEPHFLKL